MLYPEFKRSALWVFLFLSFLLILFPVTQGGAGSKGGHEKRTIPLLSAPRLIQEHISVSTQPKLLPGSCWRGRTCGQRRHQHGNRSRRTAATVPPGARGHGQCRRGLRSGCGSERESTPPPTSAGRGPRPLARSVAAGVDEETASRHEMPAGDKQGMRERAAELPADVRGGSAFVYVSTTPRQAARARESPARRRPEPRPSPAPKAAPAARGRVRRRRGDVPGHSNRLSPPARGSTASLLLQPPTPPPAKPFGSNEQ